MFVDEDALGRLPRFRFGGNRGSLNKIRVRDKKGNELRLRELSDRFRKHPVYYPRQDENENDRDDAIPLRHIPLRSASFSQIDYLIDDSRKQQQHPEEHQNGDRDESRTTTKVSRSLSCNAKSDMVSISESINTSVNNLCELIYENCKRDKENGDAPGGCIKWENSLLSECLVRNSGMFNDCANSQSKKRDKSRRRKGMYISQWPNTYQTSDEDLQQLNEDCGSNKDVLIYITCPKSILRLQITICGTVSHRNR